MKALKKILLETLAEKQRYAQQTGVKYNTVDEFKKLYEQHKSDGNLFIQYSDIPKLGINPSSTFNTPIGIYSYPAYSLYDLNTFLDGRVPFAGKRKYLVAFSYRPGSRIVVINKLGATDPSSLVSDAELKNLIEEAMRENPRFRYTFKDIGLTPYAFWSITREEANRDSKRWAALLLRKYKIQGFYDRGSGVIHGNEPSQAVFFTSQALTKPLIIENPSVNGRQDYTEVSYSDMEVIADLLNSDTFNRNKGIKPIFDDDARVAIKLLSTRMQATPNKQWSDLYKTRGSDTFWNIIKEALQKVLRNTVIAVSDKKLVYVVLEKIRRAETTK